MQTETTNKKAGERTQIETLENIRQQIDAIKAKAAPELYEALREVIIDHDEIRTHCVCHICATVRPIIADVDALTAQIPPGALVDNRTIVKTAKAFCDVIHEWLDAAELASAITQNRKERAMGTSICHTHDFCDANMAMSEAIRRTTGITPCDTGGDGTGPMSDEMTVLFNAAWSTAKQADFTASSITRAAE